MEILKKCLITRYDETITEPPYLTNVVDKISVYEPEIDYLGVEFANRLRIACINKGYTFKFYSLSNVEGVDFEIVVY